MVAQFDSRIQDFFTAGFLRQRWAATNSALGREKSVLLSGHAGRLGCGGNLAGRVVRVAGLVVAVNSLDCPGAVGTIITVIVAVSIIVLWLFVQRRCGCDGGRVPRELARFRCPARSCKITHANQDASVDLRGIACGSEGWVEGKMGWRPVIVSVVLEIVLVERGVAARRLVVRVDSEREWLRWPGLS
jgi:hypothetical protein